MKSDSLTPAKRPRRRLWQFSVGMLLFFLAVLAVLFAWLGRQARQTERDSRVAALVEKLGGKVTWGGSFEGRGKGGRSYVGAVDLSGTIVSDAELVEIGTLSEMTHLRLNDTSITSTGIRHLTGLQRLKQLELANTSIEDDALRFIGKLSNLAVLKLEATDISNEGLKHLTGLDSLWMLYLNDTPISDDGLRYVAALDRLRTLSLDGTAVTNAGLTFLRNHNELEILWVRRTSVTQDAVNPMTLRPVRSDPTMTPIIRNH